MRDGKLTISKDPRITKASQIQDIELKFGLFYDDLYWREVKPRP